MLTERSIRYIIRELKKGRGTKILAEEMNVSQRRIQQLWAEYQRTGKVHTQGRAGRPREADPSDAETEMVLDIHRRWPDGVQLTVRRLRKSGSDISYSKVCRILKSNDLVTASPAKSRQRKWVRYERLYSNAMWHTDWHTMKDPRMEGLNLITYLDDASRCVTGAALFQEATSENAVMVLRQAVDRFGVPATILSDNGSCFVGRGGRKKPTGTWTPTLFENELLALNIVLINSRPYHPQTNGKLERFHRSVEDEIWRYASLADYVEYYNTDRLHWALDIDTYVNPVWSAEFSLASSTYLRGSIWVAFLNLSKTNADFARIVWYWIVRNIPWSGFPAAHHWVCAASPNVSFCEGGDLIPSLAFRNKNIGTAPRCAGRMVPSGSMME